MNRIITGSASKIFKPERPTRKSSFFVCLALVALIVIIYGQTYHFDTALPEEALSVKYLSLSPQLDSFKTVFAGLPYPIPVPFLACFINSKVFGDQIGPRHLVNVFFHICISLMLFFIFLRTTGEIYKSGFIAALYAVHPVNVESVAWISLHETALSMLFVVSALLAYTYYITAPDRKKMSLVFILYLLALMSNYRIIMLPVLFIIFDYWPLGRISLGSEKVDSCTSPVNGSKGSITLWYSFKEKAPLLMVSCLWVLGILYYYIHSAYHHSKGFVKSGSVEPFQWLDLFTSYVGYISKLFFPVELVSDHCLVVYDNVSLSFWPLAGSIIILAVVSYLIFKKDRQGDRFYMAGWLWFLAAMLPAVFVNSGRQNLITDRYAALGSIGVFIIFTWGTSKLVKRFSYKKMFFGIAGTLFIVVLTYLSYVQTQCWRNEISLFRHATKVIPTNQAPYQALGALFLQRGQTKESLAAYQKALHVGPDESDIYNQMGVLYLRQGNKEEALLCFKKAIELMPENVAAYHNKAIIDFEKYFQIEPYYFKNKFSWLIAMGKPAAEAVQDVYKGLGSVFFMQAKATDALRAYQQALDVGPADADIYNKMGEIYLSQKNIAEALRCFKKAIQSGPGYGYAMAHHNLGNVFIDTGEIDKAIVYFKKALQIEPYFFKTHNSLATAFLYKQKPDKAIIHLEEALRINPDYDSAIHNLKIIKNSYNPILQ